MLGWMLAAGCYTYVPVAAGPVPDGSPIRAKLNAQGTSAVASRLGPSVTAIDGKLSSRRADDALVITATALSFANGAHQELLADDTITIARGSMSGVEVRTLDRRKTTIAAVVIAGSIATVGIVALRGARADAGPNEPSPGPLTTRAPARLRIP
jgi:hypothetical protein